MPVLSKDFVPYVRISRQVSGGKRMADAQTSRFRPMDHPGLQIPRVRCFPGHAMPPCVHGFQKHETNGSNDIGGSFEKLKRDIRSKSTVKCPHSRDKFTNKKWLKKENHKKIEALMKF
jgi:hypothetical protein